LPVQMAHSSTRNAHHNVLLAHRRHRVKPNIGPGPAQEVAVNGAAQPYDIVCIAQSSWHGVWARPQQLMARFARDRRVLFVRPISAQHVLSKGGERGWRLFEHVADNLWVYSPLMLPFGRRLAAVRRLNEARIRRLIRRRIRALGFERLVLWFYAPMSQYLVGRLGEAAVVYDCTDAWERFEKTPRSTIERDRALSQQADVLFAGTGRVYETRRPLNANCHLFTCGVDCEHFALAPSEPPADLAALPRPIVGYAGLVDEARVDAELLGRMAREHPEWSIVLVGPVQEEALARTLRHSNVHLLGLKPYDVLPGYVGAFDVAMIPYKLTEATHQINPTKLLEYMAAGKPVVSSALDEVKGSYLDRLALATDHDDFIRSIERILDGEAALPVEANRALAVERSWDSVANQMLTLVEATL
jgi:glycosyltransferase involved in cell wall biosynthesis